LSQVINIDVLKYVKITTVLNLFLMYDNTCKYLAENFTEDIASWLIGNRVTLTELNPTELNVDPIRADSLILLKNEDLILHVEFQTIPKSNIPFRMTDYRLRAYRKFPQKRMRQVVVYLSQINNDLVYETIFELENTRHQFEVIRLWEQPASIFLESQGLYPFAILAQTDEPESILRTVAARIEEIGPGRVQADLAASASILAGLVLNRDLVKQILRRDIMRESVIYQDILAEGKTEGLVEGKTEGRIEEAKGLVIRLLTRKLGNINPNLLAKIEALPLERVESLGEDLLDFTVISDLEQWLA
jgi:predicted transposase/invertase (TIGR01784 family)